MICLPDTLKAWQTDAFVETFKTEVAQIDHPLLPLQQGLALSSYVSNDKIGAIINKSEANEQYILIKAGVFYSGIIAGCSCSDDPTPIDTQNEYCEMLFTIHRQTAETQVILLE